MAITTLEALSKLYNYIKTTGVFVEPNHVRLGGMWSIDQWELDGVRAQMADEGYSHGIAACGKMAWASNGNPVSYQKGSDEQWLKETFHKFFPEIVVI